MSHLYLVVFLVLVLVLCAVVCTTASVPEIFLQDPSYSISFCHQERQRFVSKHYGTGLFVWGSGEEYRQVDEILPRVWLGNVCGARNKMLLKANKIGLALSVASEWNTIGKGLLETGEEVLFLHVPGLDDSSTEAVEVIKDAFVKAQRILDDYLEANPDRAVLVYCNMGISRSASVVLYWLLNRGFNYSTAEAMIKEKRPNARPNQLYSRILREEAQRREEKESL